MRRSIKLVTLASLLVLPVAAARAAQRLDAVIPADTDMVLAVDDVPRFLERWARSPLGLAWADPQVKRFLAPLRNEMRIDRWEEIVRGETGLELDTILGAFKGQLALLVPDAVAAFEASEDAGLDRMAVLAEIGPDETVVRRLLALDLDSARAELGPDEKLEELEEEFQGETLHVRRLTSADEQREGEGWAIVAGFAVMAEPKDYLQQLVSTLKKPSSSSPLKTSAGFRKMRQRVPETDMLAYVDFQALLPWIERNVAQGVDDPDGENAMGLSGQAVFDAMAFDAIDSLFLSTTLESKATHIDAGLQYTADRGLLKLLALGPGPVKPPSFLPDGAVDASIADFSLRRMWTAMKELFSTLNPAMVSLLDAQLQQLSSSHGVDLEKGVFGSLGDRIFTAEYLPPAEQPGEVASLENVDQIVGVSLTDRQALEMSLEALKSLAGGGGELFESTDYLGTTIFTFKQEIPAEAGVAARRFAYALTDDYLLVSIGGQGPLRAALAPNSQRGRQLWDRPDVKATLAALPANAAGLSFYDTEKMVRTAFEGCDRVESLLPDDDGEARPDFCDPAAKPDPSVIGKYFGPAVGAQYKTRGGFYGTVRLIHPRR